MADQDIALNLVAKLEEGSVQSDAQRIASDIARTFEQQFQQIGQKIAESIVQGFQQSKGIIVDQTGQPISSQQQTQPGQAPGQAPVAGNVD